MEAERCTELLIRASCEIIVQASKQNGGRFTLVDLCESSSSHSNGMLETSDLIEDSAESNKFGHNHFHSHLR